MRFTPVEEHGGFLVKRDDLYHKGEATGGKARTCWRLAQGARGLTTAGSRTSMQTNVVARIALRLSIPCHVHVPSGELGSEVVHARQAGADIIQHRPGYNSVVIARAREDADREGWTYIPFGMETSEACYATGGQVKSLPFGHFKRIVVAVGWGMSLAGILHGLTLTQPAKFPDVLGVVIGADPIKRLDKWGPPGWRTLVRLVPSGLAYDAIVKKRLGDLKLDPIYEAKCVRFLQDGDLFWNIGRRKGGV